MCICCGFKHTERERERHTHTLTPQYERRWWVFSMGLGGGVGFCYEFLSWVQPEVVGFCCGSCREGGDGGVA